MTLSPAHIDILYCLAGGMQIRQIAHYRGTSAKTVDVQLTQIRQRLNAKTTTEAVVLFLQRGTLSYTTTVESE
jgi:DNA-binding NarL/FixJ family response regulator